MKIWHLHTCALFVFAFSLSLFHLVVMWFSRLRFGTYFDSHIPPKWLSMLIGRGWHVCKEIRDLIWVHQTWLRERGISRSFYIDWEWPLQRCQGVKIWSSSLINCITSVICISRGHCRLVWSRCDIFWGICRWSWHTYPFRCSGFFCKPRQRLHHGAHLDVLM